MVEIEDAEFILSLRTDENLSIYLSPTNNHIEDQISWIKYYKIREENGEDFYFICLSSDRKEKLGLNRIYKIKSNEFEIGSWLYKSDIDQEKAVLGDLFIRSIAFEALNLEICRIEVRKLNRKVLRYTKSFNPKQVTENEMSYFFELEYNDFKKERDKLLMLLGYE